MRRLGAVLSRRFDRDILTLALPALGTLAADPLVSLVDTAFVGRLGAVELGALGVDSSLFALAFFAFNFLSYGTTPLVARALGRGDRQAAGRAIVQSFTLALLLGGLALFALQLLARPALLAMGATGELMEPALGYLRIRALAAPAVLLILAANGAYRGFGDTRTPFWITLALNVVNLVLDPLLIFTAGLGLEGAAWATVIAQWFGAGLFIHLLLGRDRANLGGRLTVPKFAEMLPFLRIGWELSVRTFSLVLTLALATAVATRLGVVQVATHQVAIQLWLFLALVIDALAIAAQSLVARFIGEGRAAIARAVADRLLLMSLVTGAVLGVLFWLVRQPLAGAFTDDELVVARLLTLFPFVAAMQPINALVFVWDGIFIGAQEFGYLARAMVVASLVGAIALLLVLPLDLGLTGVWWGLVILTLTRLGTLVWRYWWARPAWNENVDPGRG